jgi:hypothetical protein
VKRDLAAGGLGAALVAAAVYLAASGPTGPTRSTGQAAALALVVLAALALSLWKVRGALDDPDDATAVPWAPDEPFASPSPEVAGSDHPLSSVALTRVVEAAGERARRTGDVEAGLEEVRPPLRRALVDALVAGGHDEAAVEAALSAGDWTDDPVAAWVLDASVDQPERSLRRRFEAWLFPERVGRRLARRAVNALGAAADDALPTVPGQTAPREVPVVRPSLSELQRGVDGRLQAAVDPSVVARGPKPPSPPLDGEEGEG